MANNVTTANVAAEPPIVALVVIRTTTTMVIVEIDARDGYAVLAYCGLDSPVLALLPAVATARGIRYAGIIDARLPTA